MSTCYVIPMSHQWHSFLEPSEPVSPTTTAPISRATAGPQHHAPAARINTPIPGSFSSDTWSPSFSLQEAHGLVASSSYSVMDPEAHIVARSKDDSRQDDVYHSMDTYLTQSPVTRQVPTDNTTILDSPAPASVQDTSKGEDDDAVSGSDLEDIAEDEVLPQTAAERRAAKRKMKRFRLTHNQTRFLLSEFARQPHPDAAQRERLSREIPGLSSRQVQVWFQNRRAKLKRLSVDDRERMMRSRALPENFDRSSTLHSGLPPTPQSSSNTALSPSYSPPVSGIPSGGFLRYGHVRRVSDESAISPGSNPSMPSESLWTSGSMPESETQSPISPVADRSAVWGSIASQLPSPGRAPSYSRSQSFPAIYQPQPQQGPQYSHGPLSRMRTASLASPAAAAPPSNPLGQAPEVPIIFGRPCPPPAYGYAQQSPVGLAGQQTDIYVETQGLVPPHNRTKSHPEDLDEPSPSLTYNQQEPPFSMPPSPNAPLPHGPLQNQGLAYHRLQASQQTESAPVIIQPGFARPAFPEYHPRPPIPPYPTNYPIAVTQALDATLPQAPSRKAYPYHHTRASVSGPPTQQDIMTSRSGAAEEQRQQVRVDIDKGRSSTHSPHSGFAD